MSSLEIEKGRSFLGVLANLNCVLVLNEVELIFVIAARKGLWFGFVLKTGMMTQGCFS